MTIDNIAWFFTFTLAAIVVVQFSKSYIDNKIRAIEMRLDAEAADNDRARQQIWREIDSVWEKQADCKSMSKNYYNSENEKCCKSAQEYLKG